MSLDGIDSSEKQCLPMYFGFMKACGVHVGPRGTDHAGFKVLYNELQSEACGSVIKLVIRIPPVWNFTGCSHSAH